MIIHKWNLCNTLVLRLQKCFENKADPDQAALVRAALFFANGDMKYLIIPQVDFVLYAREAALNVFVNKGIWILKIKV